MAAKYGQGVQVEATWSLVASAAGDGMMSKFWKLLESVEEGLDVFLVDQWNVEVCGS